MIITRVCSHSNAKLLYYLRTSDLNVNLDKATADNKWELKLKQWACEKCEDCVDDMQL